MARRRGQHHGDLRRALLDAALALVAETSPEALSLRAVARRAGVTAAAPYHHFQDKTTLLATVACEGFESLMRAQATIEAPDGAALLREMASVYVRFALEHPTHYAVMFRVSPEEVPEVASVPLKETAMRAFGNLMAAFAAANPTLPPEEVRRRALLGWAQAHGAVQVVQWADALDPSFDPDTFAAGVGEAVLQLAMASL
ncbi:MAG: TetR/AcrR family transcriptional regulator [Myxococcota bacterium]